MPSQSTMTALSTPSRRPARFAAWRGLPFTAQLLAAGMLLGLAWFLAIQVAEDRRQSAARERTEARLALARVEADVARLGEALATWEQARLLAAIAPDSSQLGRLAAERALVDRSAAAITRSRARETSRINKTRTRRKTARPPVQVTKPRSSSSASARVASVSAVATAVATAAASRSCRSRMPPGVR